MSRAEEYLMSAIAALEAGDLPTATSEIDRAEAEPSEWPLRGNILHGVAFLHRRAGNLERALKFWEAFLDGAGETGNGISLEKVHRAWYNYGLTLRESDREGDAVDAYKRAISGFRSTGYTDHLCAAYTNLAWTWALRNEPDAAQVLHSAAIFYAKTTDDYLGLQLLQALISHVIGRNDAAYELADGLYADDMAPADVRCEAAYILASIAEKQNDVGRAFAMLAHMGNYAQLSGEQRLIRQAECQIARLSSQGNAV